MPPPEPVEFFTRPDHPRHVHFEILRLFFAENLTAEAVGRHLQFFHLSRLSAAMVIRVDFDLTLTVLAFNPYRLFARDLPAGWQRGTAQTLFKKLFATGADIALEPGLCTVALKKKRNLPALLETVAAKEVGPIPWLGDRRLVIAGASRT